jgi:hypothetical protein
MLGGAKLGHNIYLPIRRPLMRAQGSTTNSNGMRISLLLTRGYPMAAESDSIGARVFLLNLIDLGYAPLMVDNWCDALLNDQIDDGMPMDLVDAYWGQPVETQEFVEYYVPYEVCTYRTADGDYRQVTYKNGVVSRSTSNVADVRIR